MAGLGASKWTCRPLHHLAGHVRSFDGVSDFRPFHADHVAAADAFLFSCDKVSKIATPAGGGMTCARLQECILGVLGMIWGFWLVIFHSYQLSPVLQALRDWQVPEYVMVMWPALAGACLLALPPRHRRNVHLVMCAFWAFVAVAVAQTNLALTAIPVYGAVAILHGGSYVLADRDEP